MARPVKRAASEEQHAPKKRCTSRGPHTPPVSRDHNVKPFNIQDARVSSEKLSQALLGSTSGAGREPSPSAEETLQPAPRMLSAPPALSPPEKLSSIVRKIPASSGSADMDLSDDSAPASDPDKNTATAARNSTPATEHKETPEENVTADMDEAETGSEPGSEMDEDEVETPATETESVAAETAEQDMDSSDSESDDVEMSTLSDQFIDMTGGESELHASSSPESLDEEPLPPAVFQIPDIDDADDARRRLGAVERLIGPAAFDKIPRNAWRSYMAQLERQRSRLRAMNHENRLNHIKRIIYLAEEMELLYYGDAERMTCAIHLCRVVTEVLGSDDEAINKEMSAWVDMHTRDIVWKLKLTAAARDLLPISRGAVRDGGDGLHMDGA